MLVSLTAIYASILALIILALGINVTRHRIKLRVPLGDGGNPADAADDPLARQCR